MTENTCMALESLIGYLELSVMIGCQPLRKLVQPLSEMLRSLCHVEQTGNLGRETLK